MKLKPYKEMISYTEEKLNEAMAPVRAKRTKSKAQFEMSKLDEEILTLEEEVQELCLEKDVNFDRLLNKLDEIALLERRKEQYQEVLSQLFPDE